MRIAIAQLNYKIGDFKGNFEQISEVIHNQHQHADLIVFSELCLCGYYPMDLVHHLGFIEEQDFYFDKIKQLTAQYDVGVVIGLITKNQGKGQPFHNSLALIKGNEQFIYHKKLLPVYNIFDEARHFAPGKQAGIYQFGKYKLGFLICEDGWAGLDINLYEGDPVNDLIGQQLDAIICINGSPSNIGKQAERIEHFSAIAKRTSAPVLFSNQVGGNDEIVFDGTSFVVDKQGKLLGSLKSFTQDVGVVSLEKEKLNLLSGFTPYQTPSLVALFYQQIILGLRDYVSKCGFKTVVIGVSGGIDSAITIALAVKALGADKVFALAMPSRYSSSDSLEDAKTLCHALQVKMHVVPIEEEFRLALDHFQKTYQEEASSLTQQNIQARLRGRILMEFSNQYGALVLSTGNKSELSVGYTTLYGDMTGGFNLIGDIYKTEVYQLAQYFNELYPDTPIPHNTIKKAPTAELAPNQKDSDTLPEYPILDPILKLYIEGDLLPKADIQRYQSELSDIPSQLIAKIHHMVDKAEFKRRQAPPIIRVQRRAFGYGRQLPIAATYPKPH
jgi:NAD+ synthetase